MNDNNATEHSAVRPKVFVSQDNEFDYSIAEEYGEVVFLSNREISAHSASSTNMNTIHHIESVIAGDYVPGIDYLLPSGGVLSIAHMFRAAFRKGDEHLILKWDRRSGKYFRYKM